MSVGWTESWEILDELNNFVLENFSFHPGKSGFRPNIVFTRSAFINNKRNIPHTGIAAKGHHLNQCSRYSFLGCQHNVAVFLVKISLT